MKWTVLVVAMLFSSVASAATYQEIAQGRANTMAARNYRGHLSGIPAGCFEGVGWGGWGCATCVGSGTCVADAQAMSSSGVVFRVRLWTGGSSYRSTYRTRRWFRRR